jgi:hypothetical protein
LGKIRIERVLSEDGDLTLNDDYLRIDELLRENGRTRHGPISELRDHSSVVPLRRRERGRRETAQATPVQPFGDSAFSAAHLRR